MKGIVFTEFFEMIEEKFGLEMVDDLITESDLKSNGIYTSVGTYDFFEMQSLLGTLSKKTGIAIDDLIYTYGLYFFNVLLKHHPDIFAHYNDPLDFLGSIEDHIHVQVRKIYPEAELPTFAVTNRDDSKIEMVYKSERAMYMFAKALMEKSFEHFNKQATIDFVKLNDSGTQVKFMISTQHGGTN